jgi:hypothetical protein
MTQREQTPSRQLPPCAEGHRPRYMLDLRRPEAKGGHFIECRCSHTQKFASFELAWIHWHKLHGLQPKTNAAPVAGAKVLQLGLRLGGGSTPWWMTQRKSTGGPARPATGFGRATETANGWTN